MNTIIWLREDLRLTDNPALHFAAQQGSVTPVFIYPLGLGGASKWWLHHSLVSLKRSFAEFGVELILRKGDAEKILPDIAKATGSDRVVWNRVYSPNGIATAQKVMQALESESKIGQSFSSQLLIEPTRIFTKQGTPFKVFTPFWRHCLSVLEPGNPLQVPEITPTGRTLESDKLENWDLLPFKPDWSAGLKQRWLPGEFGAEQRLEQFLSVAVHCYRNGRDIPGQENTSMLSPHLAFGEVSPRQIWFAVHEAMAANSVDADNGNKFLSEIGWREFSRYLLVHFPKVISEPFNAKFDEFPWGGEPQTLKAWQKGQTGYPIVDAGMRELWATGYMHNRVRMVVASFLTKHLRTHWHAGMDWFWDTLVDADIANNTASWQWASGCGADAAPYFRIFNPILQGEKFDAEGHYVKKWVPELADLPKRYIHKPWEADPMTLQLANVRLGDNYPLPIVDHKQARESALSAYQEIRTVR